MESVLQLGQMNLYIVQYNKTKDGQGLITEINTQYCRYFNMNYMG